MTTAAFLLLAFIGVVALAALWCMYDALEGARYWRDRAQCADEQIDSSNAKLAKFDRERDPVTGRIVKRVAGQ